MRSMSNPTATSRRGQRRQRAGYCRHGQYAAIGGIAPGQVHQRHSPLRCPHSPPALSNGKTPSDIDRLLIRTSLWRTHSSVFRDAHHRGGKNLLTITREMRERAINHLRQRRLPENAARHRRWPLRGSHREGRCCRLAITLDADIGASKDVIDAFTQFRHDPGAQPGRFLTWCSPCSSTASSIRSPS